MDSASDRVLRGEMEVSAPVAEVSRAWTTNEGIAPFFGPRGHVDLRVDGTHGVWLDPGAEPGERAAEGPHPTCEPVCPSKPRTVR
jgi:uncharacterized protein YndB with AHSA1/START domain